jgi:hypothetical protein
MIVRFVLCASVKSELCGSLQQGSLLLLVVCFLNFDVQKVSRDDSATDIPVQHLHNKRYRDINDIEFLIFSNKFERLNERPTLL